MATTPPAWHTLAAQIEAELQADIAAYAQEVSKEVERSFTMGKINASLLVTLPVIQYRITLQRIYLDLDLHTHLS